MVDSHHNLLIGATGNIGQQVVKTLLSKDIKTTVFARNAEKVKELFGDSKSLTVVQGDYDNLEPYSKTIQGHARLFLLLSDLQNMQRLATAFAKLAYEAGVSQIVHLSSMTIRSPWRSNFIGDVHRRAEEAILAIPNRRSYVALRPTSFFTNHLWQEKPSIQSKSMFSSPMPGSSRRSWISIRDIADLASIVLQDPIEKHFDAVYELASEVLTQDERAKIFTKVLGKPITHTQVDPETTYNMFISIGMPHNIAYCVASFTDEPGFTPGLSILLGRKPESFEEWLQQNKSHFL
ncbi:NAD(P)-binding protein [Basidiobolus meristosporus CBS 931.73]|uniref:NAD(P)-binding protein n=1 Tax=Basidiobolus meristosporus CBS 931.73 TaxID=1314790 RepID=A0A1Y1YMK7_9FUNG|nr:NAD(P)-binding protein [Basidiobolus meristosporus CBS 931.73]|eukprot:ORX99235.1 NAD(P)-binding protein [Basidiobolus meristosporus CBS 931.73]